MVYNKPKGKSAIVFLPKAKDFLIVVIIPYRQSGVSIQERSPKLTIENLHFGTYALAFFHDLNEDGKLNRNFLGIPKEGFGFSQNPQIQTSPPSFGESAVLVIGAETNLQVQMRYF